MLKKLETELKIRGFSPKTISAYKFHNEKFLEFLMMEKGIEKGQQEGLLKAIYYILEIKFGEKGLSLFKSVEPISNVAMLQELCETLKQASSSKDAKQAIQSCVAKFASN